MEKQTRGLLLSQRSQFSGDGAGDDEESVMPRVLFITTKATCAKRVP